MEIKPNDLPDSFIGFDEFPVKKYACERLAKAITDAEKKLVMSDPSRVGVLEYYAQQALPPWKLEERKQQQARERHQSVVRYFCVVFAAYLTAHLDSQRDYNGMRALLPTIFRELLDQTFFKKWLQDPWADRDSEYAKFGDAVEHELCGSEEWAGFIRVLDQMSRKAGNPQPPGDLPFKELVQSATQPPESSEPASPPSAPSALSMRDLDGFASEAARTSALADYQKRWNCSAAALARTAFVDSADLSRWKKGLLSSGSEKKTRIENALKNDQPATPIPNRPKRY